MSVRKKATPEPLLKLHDDWQRANKRMRRAYVQRGRAEGAARKRGADLRPAPGFVVGGQRCLFAREIERAGVEVGFPKKRIAELVGHLRKQEFEARKRREAAGLKPFDVELNAAGAEWSRALAAIARTPARSVAGLAIKLRFIARDIQDGPSREANKMARSALADALRLARVRPNG